MADLNVDIVKIDKQVIYGVWGKSNDKSISTDIKALSARYQTIILSSETVFPYFVLTRNYNEKANNFEIFIGSTIKKDNLERFIIPGGKYAKVTVKPKLGFLWGVSIGQAKRYFYTKWLPQNPYKALNMEYEYHTTKSVGKQPNIDIIFGIEKQ